MSDNVMTDKQKAIETIQRLPETATLDDIMAELYVRQKIERGLEDMRAGRTVSHEEAKRRVGQWLHD